MLYQILNNINIKRHVFVQVISLCRNSGYGNHEAHCECLMSLNEQRLNILYIQIIDKCRTRFKGNLNCLPQNLGPLAEEQKLAKEIYKPVLYQKPF